MSSLFLFVSLSSLTSYVSLCFPFHQDEKKEKKEKKDSKDKKEKKEKKDSKDKKESKDSKVRGVMVRTSLSIRYTRSEK